MLGVSASKTRLGALSALAAMTCGAPAVCGQTASGDSGGRSVIPTFSYTGELVENAAGGARRGATFAGAAGDEPTLLLRRLAARHFDRGLRFQLRTLSGAAHDHIGHAQVVSDRQWPAA